MNTKMFLSHKTLDRVALAEKLCEHGINSNIYTTTSTVFNKAEKTNQVQQGAEVRIFDINNADLFNVYTGLVDVLGINCIWVEQDNFQGCITTMPGYAKHCKANKQAVKTCSEY